MWRCHSCKRGGSALSLIALAHGLDIRSDFREVLALGAEYGGDLSLATDIRKGNPKPSHAVRIKPAPLPPQKPTLPEAAIMDFVSRCNPVTDSPIACEYLRKRGLDPNELVSRRLACVIMSGTTLPPWAMCGEHKEDESPPQSWYEAGYRLLLPAFDHHGVAHSLRAWQMFDIDGPKRLPPLGYKLSGFVLANLQAQQLFAGTHAYPELIVVEGEPDFCTWATRSDLPIVGVGSGWWTADFAERLSPSVGVYIRTHNDTAGDAYAKDITLTLRRKGNSTYRLKRAVSMDENDCLLMGTLPASPTDECVSSGWY